MEDLFLKHNALGQEKIVKLDKATIAVDLASLFRKVKKPRSETQFWMEFKWILQEKTTESLEYILVIENNKIFPGLPTEQEQLKGIIEGFKLLHQLRYTLQMSPGRQTEEKKNKLRQFDQLKWDDGFYQSLFISRHVSQIIQTVSHSSWSFIKAPYNSENQMLSLERAKEVDYLWGSPLLFLLNFFHKTTSKLQIIKDIDYTQGIFTFYDFEDLARKLNIEAGLLSHILFGCYLTCLSRVQTPPLLTALTKSDFQEYYITTRKQCLFQIEEDMKAIKQSVVLPPKDALSYIKDLEKISLLHFQEAKIHSYQLMKSLVLEQEGPKYFPQTKPLAQNFQQMELEMFEIASLYGIDVLDKVYLDLLNSHTGQIHQLLPMRVESEFIKEQVFPRVTELIQEGLSCLLRVLQQNEKYTKKKKNYLFGEKFTLSYFNTETILKLQKTPSQLRFVTPKTDHHSASLLDSLKSLYSEQGQQYVQINKQNVIFFIQQQFIEFCKYFGTRDSQTVSLLLDMKSHIYFDYLNVLFAECLHHGLFHHKAFILSNEIKTTDPKTTSFFECYKSILNQKDKNGKIETQVDQVIQKENGDIQMKEREVFSDQILLTMTQTYNFIIEYDDKLLPDRILELQVSLLIEKANRIIFLSKLGTFLNHDLIHFDFADFKCDLFAESLRLFCNSFNYLYKTVALEFCINRQMNQDLLFLKEISNNKFENLQFDSNFGAFLKTVLTQFVFLKKVQKINIGSIIKPLEHRLKELIHSHIKPKVLLSAIQRMTLFIDNLKPIISETHPTLFELKQTLNQSRILLNLFKEFLELNQY